MRYIIAVLTMTLVTAVVAAPAIAQEAKAGGQDVMAKGGERPEAKAGGAEAKACPPEAVAKAGGAEAKAPCPPPPPPPPPKMAAAPPPPPPPAPPPPPPPAPKAMPPSGGISPGVLTGILGLGVSASIVAGGLVARRLIR